jgi:Mn2+/Fe2+ NRAMP family transporter
MAVSVKLVFPPLDFTALAFGLTIFMILLEILFSYHQYSKILKVLTLSLLAYVITGIVIKPDWVQVLKSLSLPNVRFDSSYIAAMVGVMGTTISPYLFFWQTSEEVEEREDRGLPKAHQSLATHTEIKHMRLDTFTGMALANIAFLFIVITTAFVLNKNGITNIETAEQAALALKPMFVSLMGAQAGYAAFIMFALGMLGVGLLAVPVLAGSSAYGISELFKWNEGLSKKFGQARGFYLVIIISMIIGLLMNFIGISPIKALYFAAIVNGTIAPVLLFFIFKIGRDKEIMGEHTNPRWVNIFGTAATLLMGIAAIVLIVMLALGL